MMFNGRFDVLEIPIPRERKSLGKRLKYKRRLKEGVFMPGKTVPRK